MWEELTDDLAVIAAGVALGGPPVIWLSIFVNLVKEMSGV